MQFEVLDVVLKGMYINYVVQIKFCKIYLRQEVIKEGFFFFEGFEVFLVDL